MRKFFKKPISKVLALLLIMSLIPAAAFGKTAEVDINPDISGSKTAVPTELTSDDRQTTVTLSLPSAEYKHNVDVVFVMDKSTSASPADGDFTELTMDLLDEISQKNVNLKVGVVKFKGMAVDAIDIVSEKAYSGLTEYSDETKEAIENALKLGEEDFDGHGSNIHGGMKMADDLLSADSEKEVPDDQKYVILLTDAKTYIWTDENDIATCIYSQFYNNATIQNSGNVVVAQAAWRNKETKTYRERYTDSSKIVHFMEDSLTGTAKDDASFAKLYSSDHEELTNTTDYDNRCHYAYQTIEGKNAVISSVVPHDTTNTFTGDFKKYYEVTLFDEDGIKDYKYLQANPYNLLKDEEGNPIITGGKYTFDTTSINDEYYMYHVSSLEKGTYKAAHLWNDMIGKYNCATVYYKGGLSGGGLSLSRGFCNWLRDESDYSADIKETGELNSLFDAVKEDIIYMVASGVVTDTIPNEAPGKFVLVKPEDEMPFAMTVGGETLTATADGENKWNYGEADATGTYPYVIEFDEADNSYTWTINVPIENVNPVTLSYKLEIDENTPDGEYPTNKGAVLAYKTSDDEPDDEPREFEFEIPEVTYGRLYTITYDLKGGTSTEELVYKCPAGVPTPRIADPTKKDYHFMGWEPEVAETVTGDATYVAKWEPTGIGGGGGPSGSVKYVLKYESNGGTEYPDEYYSAGTRVHLDKTPIKKDYTFTGWYADEELTKPISEVLMNSDHTVYAGWEKTPVPEFFGPDHINFIVGYPDGMVHPEANITRAEVTSIFFRLLDEEVRNTNMSKTNPFGDVSEDDWFNTSVSTMSRLGIVKGYEDGDFHPNSPITRAEFAAIAARFDKRATNGSTAFSDIAGHWAELEIIKAAENGWVSGYPDGTFQPNKNITRAEAVAIVNRVLSRNPESEADLLEGMLRFPDNSNISIWYYLDIQEAANSHEYERKENNTEKWTQLIPLEDWVSIER